MKKIIALLLSALMLTGTASVLSGCHNNSEKGKVYYLNPNPEADDTWQALAAHYTEETGVEVKIVSTASGSYEDALREGLASADAPTLFQCNSARDLEKWSDYCLDLTETDVLKEMTSTDFNLTDKNGAVKAIGYCYEAFGIIVNKELLEEAGYEITDITDFASLKATVEDIHTRADQLGFDAFVTPNLNGSNWILSGSLANAPAYYHLANMPLFYEFRDDNITEQPTTIKGTYLAAYKNIWDLAIRNSPTAPAELTVNSDISLDDFGTGKAVFWQQGTWIYSNLVGDTYDMKSKNLQMIPIYCGVEGEANAALCCGTENRWTVNAKASEADIQATLDFLKWVVTSSIGTAEMAQQFGSIPFRAAKEPDNVFFADANRLIADGKYIVNWTFHHTPDVDQWRAGVVAALTDYSAGNGKWDAVEAAFIDGWAAQYEKQDQ